MIMGTTDVLKFPKIAQAKGSCILFKTSRETINHEIHEQIHMIFLFIIFSTMKPRYFNDYRIACPCALWVYRWLFIQSPIFPKLLIRLVWISKYFDFQYFFCFLTLFWFDKARMTAGLCFQLLHLPIHFSP